MIALSDSSVAAISVAAIAAAGTVLTAVIGLFNRKEVKRTQEHIDDLSLVNSADHTASREAVALALSRLTAKVDEHHHRTGERFQRLGERIGEVAQRQETMMTSVNERIDHVGERIDKVIDQHVEHLQHHIEGKEP